MDLFVIVTAAPGPTSEELDAAAIARAHPGERAAAHGRARLLRRVDAWRWQRLSR